MENSWGLFDVIERPIKGLEDMTSHLIKIGLTFTLEHETPLRVLNIGFHTDWNVERNFVLNRIL